MLKLKKMVCIASLVGLSAGASAATTTAKGFIDVTLNLQNACVVAGGSPSTADANLINFGKLDFGSPTTLSANVDAVLNVAGTSGIQMQCSSGQNYTIALDGGINTASGDTTRYLKSTSGVKIPYVLYSDSARQIAWGSGSFGASVTKSGDGTVQSYPVYGRIPLQTILYASGTYTDRVGVTITWN